MSKPLKTFITYAHKDKAAKDKLITHLAVMERGGKIKLWDDNEILPGDEWRDAIFSNLADSDLLLYLVSTASLASENCNKELAEALNVNIRVLPIILESSDWLNYQLSDFQALPDTGKPINKWQPESKGWQNVVDGIRKVVEEIQAQVDSLSGVSKKELRAELAFQQGNFLLMLGQTDRATEVYSHTIELKPGFAEAYINRGITYDKQGEVDRAIVDYNTAIQLNPNYAAVYNNRGIIYGNKGEHECAIEDFTKAIALKQDYAIAYNNRGAVYRAKGDYDYAIEDCNRAIKFKPDYAEPYNNRGATYRNKGEVDRAIEDYNTAIKLKSDFVEAFYNRGIAYYERREFDRAIEDYTKAIQLKPELAEAYYNRGNAYSSRGDDERAIEDYTMAIGLRPELAQANYNRGEVWLRLREWEKAKADLITAKNMGVDIVAAFRNDYKNASAFERANRVKLPEDIAVLVRKGFRSRYPKMEKVLTADGKSLESSEVWNLVETLRNAGPPLGEYVKVSPYFGIKTAPTEVFVVDRATRDGLIAAHPSSADILKPFLHGRAIRRWQVEPPEQWLIFAYRGIEIDAYPAIRKHLEKHREALSKRRGKGEWYELQAPLNAPERFAKPKLVGPNLYNTKTFAVETDGFYCGYTCCIIPTEETWLCGLLNTRTVEWFYSQVSKQLGAGELQARIGYIKQIPIPDINATQKDLVRKLVDYLIYLRQQPTTNSKDLAHANDFVMLKYFERIINGLFYEFYMPDLLQKANRDLFKHLMDEQLPEVDEIRGDKMPTFRAIFEHLIHRKHPVQVNLFFQDGLRPIRIIEDKW